MTTSRDCVSTDKMSDELLDTLKWMAEKHITREYRTHTIGEHEARQILAALSGDKDGEPVAEIVAVPEQYGEKGVTFYDVNMPVGTKLYTHPLPELTDDSLFDMYCEMRNALKYESGHVEEIVANAARKFMEGLK